MKREQSFAGLSVTLLIVLMLSKPVEAAFEAECPEEIKTKQTSLAPPKGWAVHVDTVNSRQIFTGLQIFEGHPKDGAPLSPEAGAPPAEAAVAPADSTAVTDTIYKIPVARETYVVCQYSDTNQRLIKKVTKDATTCRVRFSETLGHVQKAVCQ